MSTPKYRWISLSRMLAISFQGMSGYSSFRIGEILCRLADDLQLANHAILNQAGTHESLMIQTVDILLDPVDGVQNMTQIDGIVLYRW
jgi:hypothetical protein